jgi:hypothetical protein
MKKFATAIWAVLGAIIGALAGVAVIHPLTLYIQAQHPREPKGAVAGAAWFFVLFSVPCGAMLGVRLAEWRYPRDPPKDNSHPTT